MTESSLPAIVLYFVVLVGNKPTNNLSTDILYLIKKNHKMLEK